MSKFETALRNVAKSILHPINVEDAEERRKKQDEVPEIQLQLRSGSRLMQFRELGVRFSASEQMKAKS